MAWTFSKVFMNKLFQSPLKGRPQQEGGCRPEEQHHKGEKTEKIPVRVRGSFLRKVETNEAKTPKRCRWQMQRGVFGAAAQSNANQREQCDNAARGNRKGFCGTLGEQKKGRGSQLSETFLTAPSKEGRSRKEAADQKNSTIKGKKRKRSPSGYGDLFFGKLRRMRFPLRGCFQYIPCFLTKFADFVSVYGRFFEQTKTGRRIFRPAKPSVYFRMPHSSTARMASCSLSQGRVRAKRT